MPKTAKTRSSRSTTIPGIKISSSSSFDHLLKTQPKAWAYIASQLEKLLIQPLEILSTRYSYHEVSLLIAYLTHRNKPESNTASNLVSAYHEIIPDTPRTHLKSLMTLLKEHVPHYQSSSTEQRILGDLNQALMELKTFIDTQPMPANADTSSAPTLSSIRLPTDLRTIDLRTIDLGTVTSKAKTLIETLKILQHNRLYRDAHLIEYLRARADADSWASRQDGISDPFHSILSSLVSTARFDDTQATPFQPKSSATPLLTYYAKQAFLPFVDLNKRLAELETFLIQLPPASAPFVSAKPIASAAASSSSSSSSFFSSVDMRNSFDADTPSLIARRETSYYMTLEQKASRTAILHMTRGTYLAVTCLSLNDLRKNNILLTAATDVLMTTLAEASKDLDILPALAAAKSLLMRNTKGDFDREEITINQVNIAFVVTFVSKLYHGVAGGYSIHADNCLDWINYLIKEAIQDRTLTSAPLAIASATL